MSLDTKQRKILRFFAGMKTGDNPYHLRVNNVFLSEVESNLKEIDEEDVEGLVKAGFLTDSKVVSKDDPAYVLTRKGAKEVGLRRS